MPHHSRLASFVVGAFCIGHLYAQGLWHWEGPSTHSTPFVVSKQRDFPGVASGFCPVALASELRRNARSRWKLTDRERSSSHLHPTDTPSRPRRPVRACNP